MGSSNYITNFVGDVSQHMEYFAFGESFVEEHKNSNNSPYKYNGKELDEESGYTYYGARYLDMRYSIWNSVDPLADYNPFYNDEHYIDGEHNGGVYNSGNLNPYIYCYQSPVIYVDPNGKQGYSNILTGAKRLITHGTAATLGAAHAVASAYSLGLGDLTGATEPPKGMSKEYLISYYAGRAIADIGMISEGGGIAAGGGTVAATTGVETLGVGAVVGGGAAAYGGGVALTGSVDLAQSLAKLMSLGVDLSNQESQKGGGKNGQHANQKAKQSAEQKYNQAKSEYDALKSKPNKTKADNKALDKLKTQVEHLKKKADYTGENHSRNAKGNR